MNRYLLYRVFLLFVFTVWIFHHSWGQKNIADSLWLLIKKDKADTNQVIHLNILCSEYTYSGNYDSAFKCVAKAAKLAKELHFEKGIAAVYNNIGNIYTSQSDYGKALSSYQMSLRIREKLSDVKGAAVALNNIGNIYFHQSDYAKALENYYLSLELRKNIDDTKGIADCYINIGSVYNNIAEYEKALDSYLKSLKLFESLNNKEGIAGAYTNIGCFYLDRKEYNKSLENHIASSKLFEQINNKQGISLAYSNIGLTYFLLKEYDKALENNLKSLKVAQEINNQRGFAECYNNIGNIYGAKKEYINALSSYTSAFKIFSQIGDIKNKAWLCFSIAGIYQEQNNEIEAEHWLFDGLTLAKKVGNPEMLQGFYKSLFELYEKKVDQSQAYKFHKLYSAYKDTIFNNSNNRLIAEMQAKYETDRKEKELKIKSQELREQEILLSKNRTLLTLISVGALLIIVLGWFIFYRYRINIQLKNKSETLKQQKQNAQAIIEAQEQERKRIAQDLHDGMGGSLAAIKVELMHIQSSRSDLPVLDKVISGLGDACNDVRTISHNLTPLSFMNRTYIESVRDLIERFSIPGKMNITFDYFPAEGLNSLPGNIKINSYRIIQELLNNISKHANATRVELGISIHKDELCIIVEDNGKGFDPGTDTKGIGLINIKSRLDIDNGKLTIDSKINRGTTFNISIPLFGIINT